jgi:hypothetical protein
MIRQQGWNVNSFIENYDHLRRNFSAKAGRNKKTESCPHICSMEFNMIVYVSVQRDSSPLFMAFPDTAFSEPWDIAR